MIVENIKTIHRSYSDVDLTRSYVTTVDKNNKRTLSIVEYTVMNYDKTGKVESTNVDKGTKFDKKV